MTRRNEIQGAVEMLAHARAVLQALALGLRRDAGIAASAAARGPRTTRVVYDRRAYERVAGRGLPQAGAAPLYEREYAAARAARYEAAAGWCEAPRGEIPDDVQIVVEHCSRELAGWAQARAGVAERLARLRLLAIRRIAERGES